MTTLHHFDGANGKSPDAGLWQASDGNLYGTTRLTTFGSHYGSYGSVFRCSTNGEFTLLVFFDGLNGRNPVTDLVQGPDGFIYGTTTETGVSNFISTIFKLSTNGSFSSLISFDAGFGFSPTGLTVGTNGLLYGTTSFGAISNWGNIFSITTNGVLTSLIQFTDATGANPHAPLTLGPDGNFYGITSSGGSNYAGTFFRLTHAGNFTIISHLPNSYGGLDKYGLTLGRDGNFYGFFTGGELEIPADLSESPPMVLWLSFIILQAMYFSGH